MLNKLQAIIKNVIILIHCLAGSSVGVRRLRTVQASPRQRGEDPQRRPPSGLVTPPRKGGGSVGPRDTMKGDRGLGRGNVEVERAPTRLPEA